jgi:hypothetical protein
MSDDLPPNSSGAARWDGAILVQIAEINEQLLDLLHAAAAGPVPGQRLVQALRRQWCECTPPVRRRLAACPYLLIDAGFGEVARWLPVPAGVQEVAAIHGYFQGADGVALLRRALLFAWHLARANPLSARITLGMSAACVQYVAARRLRDLETLAERCPGWIRPRWDSQPRIWEQLISAAAHEDPGCLRRAQLRGLALLAAGIGRAADPHGEDGGASRAMASVC